MYAIVVVGYNRDLSLGRLLSSLSRAYYYDNKVDLIISIDKSDNEKVRQVARDFKWKNGEKELRFFEERQGLKKHILSCGDYLERYDAIAILEDDLIVSPYFYKYMIDSVEYYCRDKNIAGISLYSHYWNVIANLPFQPMMGKKDTYFIQFAQSWGQIWLREQWKDFKKWYNENEDIFEEDCENPFPKMVEGWSDSSWLKYHIKYCVERNKFFVYPYISLTTNFTETGTHNKKNITRFQVPLLYEEKEYDFADFQIDRIKYDVFFENNYLRDMLQNKYPEICVDLYGTKPNMRNKKFLLSTQVYDYKVEKSFGLELRPHEANVFEGIEGQEIFLYNTEILEKNPNKKNEILTKVWNYNMRERFLIWNEILPVVREKIENVFRG